MLKNQYKKYSRLLHPDKNNFPGAKEAYQRLQNAYTEITKDINFISQYDFQSARMSRNQNRQPQYGMGITKWYSL